MAASNVSSFLEKLGVLILQEASLFGEVEGQVKLLRDELKWMRLFLKDADSQCIYNEKIKLWVDQIRDVTYDAEDVIDEFILKMHHQRQQRLDSLKFLDFLPTCVSFADKLPFIHELGSRVKEINIMIKKIMANRSKYGLESLMPSSSSTQLAVAQKERGHPIVEDTGWVGIEDDIDVLKRMLIDDEKQILIMEEKAMEGTGAPDESKYDLETPTASSPVPEFDELIVPETMENEIISGVVSIVGMGGLGKTTLAKRVYNLSTVKQYFKYRAWVTVSQEYGIGELLMEIANCVKITLTDKHQTKKVPDLGEDVGRHLLGTSYLIVLDDIWSLEVWEELRLYFPKSSRSRVLITTRNQEIASQVSPPEYRYELRTLDPKKSEKLFLSKVFQEKNTTAVVNCPPELEKLGEKILERCKGLPLAIVVIGGLLSWREKSSSTWEKILKSMEWHLNQGPDSCMGILALSYNDLPYYLKPCFLYCGLFPEDYEISARKLIHLWIAEGFVQTRGEETMEDTAKDYLEELIHRNMIQVARKRLDGGVKSCRIHDLLRNLAISEARDSKLFEVGKNINPMSPIRARRLIVHGQFTENNITHSLHGSRVRSLISFTHSFGETILSSLLGDFKLLTVLDLEGVKNIHTLPHEIGEFTHLTYLCFRNSGITRLSQSIGRLVYLQTLDLNRCNIHHIPSTVWKLHQLRHLYGSWSRLKLSQSMMALCGWMPNLQTLEFWVDYSGRLEGDCLERLAQLTTLSIRGRLGKLT